MKNLGVAIAGSGGTRAADDFYPTPPEAVNALMDEQLMIGWPATVWEPACGDGAISRTLENWGFFVRSTDLVGRGYGEGGLDFLTTHQKSMPIFRALTGSTHKKVESIITNPPFKLAERFIRHARKTLRVQWLALLLKIQFWSAATRYRLWQDHPPAAVLPLTWRLDFTGGGAPTMDCAWSVWLPSPPTNTIFRPLLKPVDLIG